MYQVVVNFPGYKPVKRQVEMLAINLDAKPNAGYTLTIDLETEEK